MPTISIASDVWTLLADWAEETPERPPSCTASATISFAELHERRSRAAQGLRRSRRRTGRSRGAVAAQRAGLSDPLLRLRAARRHRRRGQHALSRRRGRRHRRPLGRQGAGLRAGLPAHRLPVDPGRRRSGRARQARRASSSSARSRRRRRPPSSGCGACRSTACCRARAHRRQPRRAQRAVQHLHDLGHDQRAEVRAAPPGRDREPRPAGGARLRLRRARARCRSPILPLCGVFGFNQTMATLAAGKPSVLVESYEIEEIARLIEQHRPTTMFGSDDMYRAPARARAGRAAVPVGEVGGLCRLQRRARRTSPSAPRRAA